MSRYEIVSDQSIKRSSESSHSQFFKIDEIKFANTFLNNSELFLLHNLKIMGIHYEFNNIKNNVISVTALPSNDISLAEQTGTIYKVKQNSNLNLFESTLSDTKVVDYLNKNFCKTDLKCYKLSSSNHKEIGSARSMIAKTLNCTSNNKLCTIYSTIEHNLFMSLSKNKQTNSEISYYFDFDLKSTEKRSIETTSSPKQLSKIIGYSSFNQHERLIRMRDIELYSIAFNARLHLTPTDRLLENYQKMSSLFKLSTFDNLSGRKLSLFGLDIERVNSSDKIRFKISSKQKSMISKSILINERVVNLNVTFTSSHINLQLNGEEIIALKYDPLFSTALLKAYGSFMLNFATQNNQSVNNNATTSNSLTSICLSSFRLATRKSQTNEIYQYGLIQQTKQIFVKNYNEINNQKCRYEMDISKYENDELPTQNKNSDCLLIEKINIGTSEKVDNSYHCKCNGSMYCPYDFWSNKEAKHKSADSNARIDCNEAGGYACFNNGTCVDSLNEIDSLFGYSCQCESSYTGPRCEKFDPCLQKPCSPNSECLINNEQMTYECKCNQGYEGRNCTIDVIISSFFFKLK